jgi:phosphatidylglycerol:prolipoprotein diacylglycerol transferase
MIFPNINPIIFSIGPLTVSWYSLAYVFGIIIGWFYANKIIIKFKINLSKKDLENFVSWAIIGIIIGGRLGYVLLYNPMKYFADLITILKTYEGGMSFHGAIIGLSVASYFFCRKYKINLLLLADIISTVAPIGLLLGRIANFINGELYGRVTTMPWGIIFPNSDFRARHPSQLYEAFLEGIILLLILAYSSFNYQTIKVKGLNTAIFLIFYAIFRIIIEIFREPDWHLGFIFAHVTMGQILSLPMLLLGSYLMIRVDANRK